MNIEMKFWYFQRPLWRLMLVVALVALHLTIAFAADTQTTTAPTPAFESKTAIENDFKVLSLTTTASLSMQQLRQHDTDDEMASLEKLATITTTLKTKLNPSKEESFNTKTFSKESQEKSSRDKITPLTKTTQQYKNNDKLEREIKESDLKQVTESTMAQQQQQQQQQQQLKPITTEVSWQKETDMHKQSRGNNRNAENDIKITATIATPTPTPLEHDTSTKTTSPPYLFKSKEINTDTVAVSATTTPSSTNYNEPGQVKQKEIADDDIQTVSGEIESLTLNLDATNKQAMEDFKPIIKDANEKLLKERTIFSSKPKIKDEEWKQNLMPNELLSEYNKPPLLNKKYKHNINWSPYLHPATPVTDFTGKLLQEQDGVITEIEKKFRLSEFANNEETKTTDNPMNTKTPKVSLEFTKMTSFSKDPKLASTHSVNQKILDINKSPILSRAPMEFIERRVKKSFDFPMHRVASDAQHLEQHFDFANTKFNSNNNDQQQQNSQDAKSLQEGQQKENVPPARPQPEFSTTKFYNSKELYNEMLQHKAKQQTQPNHPTFVDDKALQELNNRVPSLTLNSFAVLHSPKVAKLEEIHEAKEPQQQQQKSLAIKKVTVKATKHKEGATYKTEEISTTKATFNSKSSSLKAIADNTKAPPTKDLSSNTMTEMPLAALVKTKKFQKELKRAKLLIKSMMPLQNATAIESSIGNTNSNSNNNKNNDLLGLKQRATTISPPQIHTQLETKITSHTAASLQTAPDLITTTASPTRPTSSSSSASPLLSRKFTSSSSSRAAAAGAAAPAVLSATSTNSPKTSLHPIVRPRILSRLQEKINSLECELQNLPQDSHLWRGNETHELLLPIMTPENCKSDKDCTAMMVSWEGEAEIQSGDILIVEINDALLTPKDINLTTSAHNTQVYQVTRSGHEHCDVTEGILLDITPLIVDGRKLVTLYDKDLTEGVNLLIVVSELWGTQCVRLKVTTKTENCGENADCSGKGICFSNYDMEEYECQCCSGFAGPHCEEIDACTPSPCTNNGICVDLSQGHEGNSYQCLCPYGYTGKNCQYELDPCNPAECMNGGTCVGNSTHFRCECTPGYTGPLCQHSLNECESSPCIHGICVDQEDGFRCFCQPGFAGELCNFEYNECESNPCQNGGECIDHIGSYECHCSKGYTGNRCQIKVDFCANKPCPEGRRCIDHGNEYSCECLGGRNGPDCSEMQRTQCNVNPCTHGGTCWSSGDSFYCACRPGYTGTMCEDEFVVETVVSSSEFMVDDTSARNFNDKSFGSSVVLKSPIELHNAYTAAIVLALVIFFVALYLTICHCKVNQTYRKFSTRTYGFLPILGFRLRTKQATSKISRHWLSGKGLGIANAMRPGGGSGGGSGGATTSSSSTSSALHATTATSSQRNNVGHLPTAKASSGTQKHTHVGQLNERPFQRHLAMNLENDMYYTVDFSENSQHSPLIQ